MLILDHPHHHCDKPNPTTNLGSPGQWSMEVIVNLMLNYDSKTISMSFLFKRFLSSIGSLFYEIFMPSPSVSSHKILVNELNIEKTENERYNQCCEGGGPCKKTSTDPSSCLASVQSLELASSSTSSLSSSSP